MLRDPFRKLFSSCLLLSLPAVLPACGAAERQGPFADARPTAFGPPVTASIQVPRDMQAYRFEASEGEVIRLRARPTTEATLRPVIELFNSEGKRLDTAGEGCGHAEVTLDRRLEADGPYFVLVSLCADRTGEYALALQRLTEPVGARDITFGRAVAASLEAPLETRAYRFEASEGEVIRLRARPTSQANLRPVVELFDRRGRRLAGAGEGCVRAEVTLDLPVEADGTYYALVGFCAARTGEFVLALRSLRDPVGARDLTLGEPVTGFLEAPLETQAYRFETAEGGVIRLWARPTSQANLRPVVELFDRRGRRLTGAGEDCTQADVTLEARLEAGSYLVLLGWCSGRSGEYALEVHPGDEAASLTRSLLRWRNHSP